MTKQSIVIWVACLATLAANAAGAAGPLDLAMGTRTHEAVEEALRYLVTTQRADGAWEAFGQPHPAITALVVQSLPNELLRNLSLYLVLSLH